jgi:hypothetical protein
MCTGCTLGVVAFASYLKLWQVYHESQLSGLKNDARKDYELRALAVRYSAVFYAVYPLELLCTIFAMNLLLRRVSDHASHR